MLAMVSIAVFPWLARQMHISGGRVDTGTITPVDMGVAAGLCALFVGLATLGFLGKPREIHFNDVISSSVHIAFLLMLICGLLLFRRISLIDFFGLRRAGFLRAVGVGVGLLLLALPLILATSAITQLLLGDQAESQEIVKLFKQTSTAGDSAKIAFLLGFAVLFGPACEELIFRGYLYPVFKRYLGMWTAVLMNAALFAFIHSNLAALPALCVLALCLTIAYEVTGSLVTPYVMHAGFNLCQLGVMLYMTLKPK